MHEPSWWSLVKQRPLSERPSDPATCPYCQSSDGYVLGVSSTMLGSSDMSPDGDPNHRWVDCRCRSCREAFVRELKSGNVWYTVERARPSRVLAGVANCFEAYAYTCVTCGGDVLKQRSALYGSDLGGIIRGLGKDAECLTWYACESCGAASEKVRGDL